MALNRSEWRKLTIAGEVELESLSHVGHPVLLGFRLFDIVGVVALLVVYLIAFTGRGWGRRGSLHDLGAYTTISTY